MTQLQAQELFKDPPEWSRNANIYEVNIRQYTPEGTFKAFQAHLPRLQRMGVDILWLMPVQPIGVENRKGSLGSYYSISDYTTTNPEFGSMEDLEGTGGTGTPERHEGHSGLGGQSYFL